MRQDPEKMGDTFAFSSEIEIVSGKDKRNPAIPKRSSIGTGGGSSLRKGLMDVTNCQRQIKPYKPDPRTQRTYFATTKEYIDKLLEENLALKNQVAERSKIIELSGYELRKLRGTLQIMQQQNWQLAQVNSQILAELEAGKDKLTAMEHELGCLKCLLTVKNLEEDDKTKNDQRAGDEMQQIMVEESVGNFAVNNNENSPSNTTTSRQLPRDTDSSTSTAKDTVATAKGAAGNSEISSRESKRRRSSRLLKSKELVSSDYLFETDKAKCSVASQPNVTIAEEHSTMPNLETNNDKDPNAGKDEGNTNYGQQTGDGRQEIMVAEAAGNTSAVSNIENKPSNTTTCRQLSRASSTSSAKDTAVATANDAAAGATAGGNFEINRERKKRQSSRPKSKELVSSDYLSEADDAKCPVGSQSNVSSAEEHSTMPPNVESNNDKDQEAGKVARTRSPPNERRTSSRGRPLRRAAEKVQTYKEIQLNVKLRRTE